MPTCTLAKTDRLLKPSDFARVRKEGRRVFARRFTLFVAPNGLTHSRLGLSVGKRVGCAVVRNRVKRLIREFFRLNREEIETALGGPRDILVSAKSADGLGRYDDLAEELMAAIRKQAV